MHIQEREIRDVDLSLIDEVTFIFHGTILLVCSLFFLRDFLLFVKLLNFDQLKSGDDIPHIFKRIIVSRVLEVEGCH